mmetsp:Transcript_8671/g.9435  ORF Transcript_8671/g.9435 Transcript_8671/m.9435 type:complete len:413 (-) Transcript_8671:469-1707(-)|eukprot:CAMPEP_0173135230 /NCGR_PEP_ID=MMETSP1105-20130129/1773_1 /TAXON_ID=2985 /ORGANISM="Ochromonas sp., Strain BG-1" /LENGTH=412 /DNA_ID=CAMNT_0014047199 /DNA_START=203 /DNA_END=1441 /DNA_ORIENTATION=+
MGGAVSIGKKSNVTKIRATSIENKNEDVNMTGTTPSSAVGSNSRLDVSHHSYLQNRISPRDGQRGSTQSSPYELNHVSPFGSRPSPNGRYHSIELSPMGTPYRQPPSNSSGSSAYNRAAALLSHRSETSEGEGGGEPNQSDLFAQTAMSLGLEGDDLLFNMMFFDDGTGGTFGQLLDTMQQETLALHSENNTPYRLNPADDSTVAELIEEEYEINKTGEETECQVCKDELENGNELLRVPHCHHYFHKECLLRWIKMQAWCPVCRSSLEHSKKIGKLEAVAELGSRSTCSDERNVHIPFPDIPLDDELPEATPLSRKIPYLLEDDDTNIPQLAEAKLANSSIRFYDIDGKKGGAFEENNVENDHTRFDEDKKENVISRSSRHQSIAQRMAAQSTEKFINEAMHSLYQEKLSI